MLHNIKYNLKILFKNKALIFWTFAFPIILGFLFNMAFSNINEDLKLTVFDIAIVDNNDFKSNEYYVNAYSTLSSGKDKLFNIKYVDEKQADKLLDDKKIEGYVIFNKDTNKIIVKNNGMHQTILKTVTDEIVNQSKMANDVVEHEIASGNIDYNLIMQKVAEISKNKEVINEVEKNKLDVTMIEYYTLIAMALLYGGIISMTSLNYSLANMSNNGKRVAISPSSKFKIIISSLIASYIVQAIGIILLMLFLLFGLKIDFGNNLPRVILMIVVGLLSGLSLGTFVSSTFKVKEGAKVGIILGITMLFSFLSGMMGMTLKYYVDTYFGFVNKINPAAMITDGFYALYYYDKAARFNFNIISLLIFSGVLLLISFISLRRQKYDSI